VAEDKKDIAGYAFYFFTYSSFLARKNIISGRLFVNGTKARKR